MNKINDGGPAFPVPFSIDAEAGGPVFADCYGNGGMTLRDYFAAKAMAVILADSSRGVGASFIADRSYGMADAMLVAREKGGAA